MKLAIKIATPLLYFIVLLISMGLSVFLIGPAAHFWGGYSLFGNGDVTLAVNGLIVGFVLIALTAKMVKAQWIDLVAPIWGHLWRCGALYGVGLVTLVGIYKFAFPVYKNPGIGGAWMVAACFSSIAGIIADKVIIRGVAVQSSEPT
ncbi:hypothetical protein [Microbulbifer donghaiensis]|uniref:hypothetical protein n=1 Tax=Microbulbifer donghaiensis TaxID=494016 RepID=UPI00116106D3|nr:hypothetical protein [Microbulbifer donghaiensis]